MSRNKYKNPYSRNAAPVKLDSALDQMFETFKLKGKADQTTIINLWEELMGKTISSRTSKLFFKGTVLYVELSSAPLKQELILAKEKIKSLLNEKVGTGIIEDIVFR